MKTISKYLSVVGAALLLSLPSANAQKNLADTLQTLSQGRIVVHEPDGLQSRIESDTLKAGHVGSRIVHKAGYRSRQSWWSNWRRGGQSLPSDTGRREEQVWN